MKRVLVTGATGFIGRHTLPLLVARGYEVHALAHQGRRVRTRGVAWHRGDILNAEDQRRILAEVHPTHLLHVAWYAVPPLFWESEKNHDWAGASADLFAAFQRAGGLRALGVGSCAEYKWGEGLSSENSTPLEPATTYGRCKLQAFQALTDLAAATGISAAWSRVFYLFGPHEHPDRLVPSLVRTLRAGERFASTSGEQVRDFLHVRDVAGALIAILDSEVTGAVNAASGQPTPVRRIIELAVSAMGCPNDLVDFGSVAARHGEPAALYADVNRLRVEVGWTPELDLASGVNEAVRWWCSRQQQPTASD